MSRTFITVIGLILVMFVGSALAQKTFRGTGSVRQFAEDTAINPHDFTDDYYLMNGIQPKGIFGRRTGTDGLSVFGNSSNPRHTNVRVLATIPAYDHYGDMLYWFPLGEFQDVAFTEDKAGILARELAMQFPIYIFPSAKILEYGTFANTRQAALFDNRFYNATGDDVNPLGMRVVVVVNYTEKAFDKGSLEMMQYFLKKNGASADETPLIRTMQDLEMLAENELIDVSPQKVVGGRYALSPQIFDPTNGVIARDAFIWMATLGDRHLPSEDLFVWQFHCLQKTGNWCP
jgi:hypothetical protein